MHGELSSAQTSEQRNNFGGRAGRNSVANNDLANMAREVEALTGKNDFYLDDRTH